MMPIDKKAFTLIEMLVVVVIIGVIMAIAIPSVMNIMSSNTKKMYQTHMNIVEEKTKLFVDKNRGKLLGNNNTCIQMDYKTLLQQDFLKETDIHCEGSIILRNIENNKDITYEYYLNCVDKDEKTVHTSETVPSGCTLYSGI